MNESRQCLRGGPKNARSHKKLKRRGCGRTRTGEIRVRAPRSTTVLQAPADLRFRTGGRGRGGRCKNDSRRLRQRPVLRSVQVVVGTPAGFKPQTAFVTAVVRIFAVLPRQSVCLRALPRPGPASRARPALRGPRTWAPVGAHRSVCNAASIREVHITTGVVRPQRSWPQRQLMRSSPVCELPNVSQ